MSQKTRIAVIGLGYWGPNLLRNLSATAEATVTMCAELDEGRWSRLRPLYGSTQFTNDVRAVIENDQVDAVAIATPVHTHYEIASRALRAGKHVLVEKPMTTRVDHAEELMALAQAKGLVLMVDHVFVYSPAVTKIREITASGRLGKLLFIDSVRINLGLVQQDVNVVWDLAPHDLSIIDLLLGRLPRSLSAYGSVHASREIEDVAYLNLDFGDGLISSLHVNWLSPVKVRSMIIGGSRQSLVYNDLDRSERIKVYDRGIEVSNEDDLRRARVSYRAGDIWSPNVSNEEPLSLMSADFVAAIRESKPPLADAEAGLRVVKVLDAAQRSIKAQGGRIVL